MPVWKEDDGTPEGNIRYDVPYCLQILTDAEKMLIQMVSPFISLFHLQNGTFGLKGHVCCFSQDLESLCYKLPRLPTDVTVVKVIHCYLREINGELCNKAFKVRKQVVLDALRWLKEHNVAYNNIQIDEQNLDWTNGSEETTLPVNQEVINMVEQRCVF